MALWILHPLGKSKPDQGKSKPFKSQDSGQGDISPRLESNYCAEVPLLSGSPDDFGVKHSYLLWQDSLDFSQSVRVLSTTICWDWAVQWKNKNILLPKYSPKGSSLHWVLTFTLEQVWETRTHRPNPAGPLFMAHELRNGFYILKGGEGSKEDILWHGNIIWNSNFSAHT